MSILILEDAPADVVLFTDALRKEGLHFQSRRVETRERFLRELELHPPDVILSDHGLPEFDGFAALEVARQKRPDVPFIFVTSSTDDRRIHQALEAGAAGCVSKERLGELPRVVKQALRQAGTRERTERERTKPSKAEMAVFSAPAKTGQARQDLSEEVRRLNERIQSQQAAFQAELEAARQDLEAFSYAVSHDFRAPIRHIDGFVEILQRNRGQQLDPESQRCLEVIASSARHLGVLIDSLLLFSRISRAEMRMARVNLEAMVRDVRQELEPQAEGRKIVWKIRPLPEVWADPTLLRQALVHLLSNAVKFTAKQRTARIEIGAVSKKTEDHIFIRDNGIGFDPRYVGRLFGVFQKLQTEHAGAGVGLANVRRIMARHGGRVWAEGKPQGGAIFWFSLPHHASRFTESVANLPLSSGTS